jgi:glutathione S-transferase
MQEAKKLILITSTVCPFARRVNILIREKGLDYEEVQVDLRNKT